MWTSTCWAGQKKVCRAAGKNKSAPILDKETRDRWAVVNTQYFSHTQVHLFHFYMLFAIHLIPSTCSRCFRSFPVRSVALQYDQFSGYSTQSLDPPHEDGYVLSRSMFRFPTMCELALCLQASHPGV